MRITASRFGLACLCAVASGCGVGSPGSGSGPLGRDGSEAGSRYLHDFGVVRPGQKYSHRFPVRNPTGKRWEIEKFQINCACTVGESSAPAIEPSQTEFIRVDYTAPAAIGDEKKSVGVQFKQDDAPVIWLEVQARVRDAVSPIPQQVSFGRRTAGSELSTTVEIQSYEDHDIELGEARASCPWLSVVSRTSYRGEGQGPGRIGPRQVWRLELKARTVGLQPGPRRCELTIEAIGTSSRIRTIEVQVELAPPVEVIPATFFFGSVPSGLTTPQKALLRVAPDLIPGVAEGIEISHDLGAGFSVECSRKSGPYWELAATLTPAPGGPAEVRGTVSVRFRGAGLQPLNVPVLARVSPR